MLCALKGRGWACGSPWMSRSLAGRSGISLQVIRAGEVLAGERTAQPVEIFGWHSPTYNLRLPALSLRWTVRSSIPVELVTGFHFESAQDEL